ncbi:MAG: peptidase S10, partial [Rudaea sp.]
MRTVPHWLSIIALCALCAPVWAADKPATDKKSGEEAAPKAQKVETSGSVSVEGHKLDYKAIAGT